MFLMNAFTTTIARGLSLVSIVIAGLTFAFGEGGSKKIHGWRPVWRRHGHRRGQLPRLALSLILPRHRRSTERP